MRFKTTFLSLFAALALVTLISGVVEVQAQTANTGTITGVVKDEQGAVVPGATVKVVNIGTNAERTLQTSGDGTYEIPQLVPGMYRLEVEAPNFAKYVAEQVIIVNYETESPCVARP